MSHQPLSAEQLKLDWGNNARWAGIERPYTAEDVVVPDYVHHPAIKAPVAV